LPIWTGVLQFILVPFPSWPFWRLSEFGTCRLVGLRSFPRDWWSDKDAREFEVRVAPLIRQYDAYKPFPNLAVNGRLTLSENISDLGGLKIAYAAFQKVWAGRPRSADGTGFTPEQRFFISYAQHYRRIMRPEYLRLLVQTDNHAPAQYTVNGPLSNMDEFARAFACPDGCPMARPKEERVTVW